MISLLTSVFKSSKRQAVEIIKNIYNMPISIGSVSNIENTTSLALEPIHNQIKSALSKSKVINVDETGFKQKNKNGWAWIVADKSYTCYNLEKSRGKKVAKNIIGDFTGRTIITDRYSSYNYLPPKNHQICWAHLKRDCKKISERTGIAGVVGRRLLHAYGKIYSFYKSRDSKKYCCPKRSKKRKRYLKNLFRRYLLQGINCSHKKTSRTCKNIYSQEESLWLFLDNPDIPATNNLAERQLRPLVIAKKLSFGVRSDRGARFIERSYSLGLSCRQQGLKAMEWFMDSINSYFCNKSPPIFA